MIPSPMCRTCLHWACKRNHAAVVAQLLHAGADREILTKKGERPAQLTSKSEIRRMLGGKSNLLAVPHDCPAAAAGSLKHGGAELYLPCLSLSSS